MLFNTAEFFWFLLAALAGYYLIPGRYTAWRTGFLVVASYSFYLHWQLWYIFLLLPVTAINYACGLALASREGRARRAVLWLGVGSSLGFLAVFKYTDFLLGSFSDAAALVGYDVEFPQLIEALPVGISFFTFQALSYSIDVHRGRIDPERNFVRFALYVAFFPQLVAGPIEKAHNLLAQLRERLAIARPVDPVEACEQIAWGLTKKVVIADNIGPMIGPVFTNPESYGGATIAIAAVLFSIQIYCDFSGYTDIAIGTAKLFGIRLQKNFDYPYFAASITDFWRRWHISLSSWLKEYLYFTLGGNRHGEARMYTALLLTMLLGGLWHGPSWNFVIWGACHGLYLCVHKVVLKTLGAPTAGPLQVLRNVVGVPFTFVLVTLTWIPFVCPDLDATVASMRGLVEWREGDKSLDADALARVTLLCGALLVIEIVRFGGGRLAAARTRAGTGDVPAYGVFAALAVPIWILVTMVFAAPAGQQFIYFAF